MPCRQHHNRDSATRPSPVPLAPCNAPDLPPLLQALVWCTWALIAVLLLLLVLTYNLFPEFDDPRSWERRCSCLGTMLCCCCWQRQHGYQWEDGPGVEEEVVAAAADADGQRQSGWRLRKQRQRQRQQQQGLSKRIGKLFAKVCLLQTAYVQSLLSCCPAGAPRCATLFPLKCTCHVHTLLHCCSCSPTSICPSQT